MGKRMHMRRELMEHALPTLSVPALCALLGIQTDN